MGGGPHSLAPHILNKQNTAQNMAKPAHSQIGGFGGVGGGNLVPAFQFVALFFACAREDCALPEYPRGVNWYNDIFEIWARFWPGSPRKITKK